MDLGTDNPEGPQATEDMNRVEPRDYVFQSPLFEGQQRKAKWFCEDVSAAFMEAREAGLWGRAFLSLPSSSVLRGVGVGGEVCNRD